jgi:hypothetical protein
MGVAVADKATTFGRLEDGGLEDPEVLFGAAEREDGLGPNAGTAVFLGDTEQVGVSDVLRRVD